MMASSYYQNLIKRVLEASTTDNWEIAVREWDIVDCEEDEEHASECVCGKENLRYLFTIRNRETGRSLYPIGSSCIEKFERDDLDYEVDVQMDMYRLAHASKVNILKVYDEIEKNQIFGTKEIKEILDCSPSTARVVMTKLRDMKVVKAVNGKGKGKYVFIE